MKTDGRPTTADGSGLAASARDAGARQVERAFDGSGHSCGTVTKVRRVEIWEADTLLGVAMRSWDVRTSRAATA